MAIPEYPNEVNKISDFIYQIKKTSISENKIFYFIIDIDESKFWAESEEETKNEEEGNEEKIQKYQTSFFFTLCKNTDEEKSSGIIKFKIFPDGFIQPGFIYLNDPETNKTYTIFLNPYLNIPEIYKGEVNFEEYEQ